MRTMRQHARLVFLANLVGCICFLGLDAWPGLLGSVLFGFPLFCATLPALGFWILSLLWLGIRDIAPPPGVVEAHRWWCLSSAAVMCATIGLIELNVPPQVALWFWEGELNGLVASAPVDVFQGAKINFGSGPYTVDRYSADSRGGVFFRTGSSWSGSGPYSRSYGFAFRPNGKGSPFGKRNYSQGHLSGNWYVFGESEG